MMNDERGTMKDFSVLVLRAAHAPKVEAASCRFPAGAGRRNASSTLAMRVTHQRVPKGHSEIAQRLVRRRRIYRRVPVRQTAIPVPEGRPKSLKRGVA